MTRHAVSGLNRRRGWSVLVLVAVVASVLAMPVALLASFAKAPQLPSLTDLYIKIARPLVKLKTGAQGGF